VNRSLTWLVTANGLGLSLLLAGCAGNSVTSATPAIGNLPAAAVAPKAKNAKVRFSIHIPKEHRHRGARFISPATASISFSISLKGKTALTKHVNVTPSSPGCSASLAGTYCSFAFNIKAGNGYLVSMTAFDATNATGNVLSTGQSVAFNVKQGKLNTIPLTLDGVPASIFVNQLDNDAIVVTALDLDGNFIVGPGAPQFAASRTSGATIAAIAPPSSTSPNRIGITLMSPPTPGVETIGVTASYPAGSANACVEPGAVCSLPAAVTATYQAAGTFFAGDYGNNAVKGFSTPFTGSGQPPAYALNVPAPYAVGLDSSGNIFAMQYANGTGSLYRYATPYTGSPTSDAMAPAYANAIVVNSAGTVFVGSESTVVAELTPPYTGAPTYITSGVDYAQGLAVDSSDNLYVANYNSSKLGVYAAGAYTTQKYSVSLSSAPDGVVRIGSNIYVGEASGIQIFSAPITSSAATPIATITNGAADVYSVALDGAGDLFAANYGASTITEYPAPVTNGEAASVTLSNGLDEPCGNLTFDANGDLYAINYGSGVIAEFSPPFTNSSAPVGTSSTMSDSCYGGLVTSSTGTFSLSVL
jgi:hypothetical protein